MDHLFNITFHFNYSLFLILAVLCGIPALMVILLGTWGLKKAGKDTWARPLRKYLLILLGLAIVTLLILDWTDRNHFRSFALNERYEIHLQIEEIDSFLDQPTEYTINIEGIAGKSGNFTMQTDGCCLKFYDSAKYSVIWLEGIDELVGFNWYLDYTGKLITSRKTEGYWDNPGFTPVVEIGPGYQMIKWEN